MALTLESGEPLGFSLVCFGLRSASTLRSLRLGGEPWPESHRRDAEVANAAPS
jgi:hypothetical protein